MTQFEKISVLMFLAPIAIVCAAELLLMLLFISNKITHPARKNILVTKSAYITHFFAAILLICFIYAFFIEPYWVEVKSIRIQTQNSNPRASESSRFQTCIAIKKS